MAKHECDPLVPTVNTSMRSMRPFSSSSTERATTLRHSSAGLLSLLAVLGFALPASAYLWFVHHYGVNAIWGDQWDDVYLTGHSYSGSLGFGTLWAQHVQERMFFPNVLAVLQGRTTHLNVVFEMYLSAGLLFGSIVLLVVAHRRRSPATSWLAYCPVAILLLSFVQYQNSLWGFQIAWYMILAALALALFLLDGPELGWVALTGAIAAAVVGSFSSFQGLLIWPAGLILLYHRHRRRPIVLAWVSAAAVTGLGYFYRFNFQEASLNRYEALHDPLTAMKSFFVAIGDIVGAPIPLFSHNEAVVLFGVVLFVLALWVVVEYGVRRDTDGAGPIGVALICFGLLFAFFAATGLTSFGEAGASSSRLTTYDLLIPVGCYLAIVSRPKPVMAPSRWRRLARRSAGIGVAGAVCLQVVLGIGNGLAGGRATERTRVEAADVLVNIGRASNADVYDAFGWVPLPAGVPRGADGFVDFVRSLAPIVRSHRLSEYATADHVVYAREGLLVPPYALGFANANLQPKEEVTGRAFSFTIRVYGSPTPRLESSDLPSWLTLVDRRDGTATLSAPDPPSSSATVIVRAVNRGGAIEQAFTFAVEDQQAPVFDSRDRKTCHLRSLCTFPVRVEGWPTPKITEQGPLPSGMALIKTKQGARLWGTVLKSARASYSIELSAENGIGPPALQEFTLTVR